jgi:hypothetical protein
MANSTPGKEACIPFNEIMPFLDQCVKMYDRVLYQPRRQSEDITDNDEHKYFTDLCVKTFADSSSLYDALEIGGVTYSGLLFFIIFYVVPKFLIYISYLLL